MYKKKLIETSIPLEDINAQAVREKSIRKGHPSTLHLWWARRPLAATRCVIFASMVDDPVGHPELFPDEESQDKERERLFDIIRRLADWDNIEDDHLYREAYEEMTKYAPGGVLPELLDPFAGGGAIPLEGQRLGLVSHAADLNPIPVTLNRAMIDLPARFCGHNPVNPKVQDGTTDTWARSAGLAEDVRHYAEEMRSIAKGRIGANYPDVEVASGSSLRSATPIAYIWARTVTCPNPACHHETPLVRSFWLSKRKGHRAYVEPIVAGGAVRYEVRSEAAGWKDFSCVRDETVGRRGACCLHCGSPISLDYVRTNGRKYGLGVRPMAVVSESPFGTGRWYSSPDEASTAADVHISGISAIAMPITVNPRDFKTPNYGLSKFSDLFSKRQLVSLVTFSDLVSEMRGPIERDAVAAGMADDGVGLRDGGAGARAYAEAVSVYLACAVDKLADYCSTICTWHNSCEKMRNVFSRQAIPMTWDFAEVNPFSASSGSFESMVRQVVEAIKTLPARPHCDAVQRDAARTEGLSNLLVSTDPPYYDNIGYSDLSDYFYVWMRRSLKDVWPDTFATMLAPKAAELVATPYRFEGGAEEARDFFEGGMRETFGRLAAASSDDYPMTVYYAYKQSETSEDAGRTSSGWETMLQALMDAGLQVTGTWPMRTEMGNRTIASGSNALASSIVLVCRRRPASAPTATRPEFQRELRRSFKGDVERLQSGSVAPVDMAQAAIGPGMSVFSRYSRVHESDGTPMSVHTALGIINDELDSMMGESGEGLDDETRFCVSWYEQHGFTEGAFGDADTLARARGASLDSLVHAGVLASAIGHTRLIRPGETASPSHAHAARSCWSDLMAEVAALEVGGIAAASEVASGIGDERNDRAKTLAYILFQAAEGKGRTEDASLFNGFVTSWGDISERAEEIASHDHEYVQQSFDI